MDQPRAVFRIPPTALVAVLLLALCVTPFAFAAPGLQAVYAVPAGIAAWLLRERTTADADGLVARYLLSSRSLPWSSLNGLMIGRSGAVRAVTSDGELVRLPGVRVTDLTRLSQVSGGALDVSRGGGGAAEE
ncbi:MAG TPA: PH domain-containing protein [Pseudonocardiaceae bacterium]